MVRVNNLSYFYPDGYKPLEGVSFDIDKGSCVGIVGANGAGKSTLLYLVSGVIISETGDITIDGIRSNKQNIKEIRKRTGLVFQDSDDQLFTTTVYDDIAFGPRNMGFSEEKVKQKVINALNLCNISGMEKRAPYKLSGGEKKMAAIATIIAMEPEIIIMDEPSASLDPRARRNVIKLLSTIPKTRIIASHDLDMIWELCDKVIVLQGGKVVANGETRQILSDERLLINADLELPIRLSDKN